VRKSRAPARCRAQSTLHFLHETSCISAPAILTDRRQVPGREERPGSTLNSLTTAAEAAGPTVSQVFLAVRARGSRNGCKRGHGQSKGQNNPSHCRLLWFTDLYYGRSHGRRLLCMPECNGEAVKEIHGGFIRCALARGRMCSCGSNGKLEANFQFILNLFGDFVQIA
jgi:hypothetical protein